MRTRVAARLAWSVAGLAAAFEVLFVLFLILNSSDPRVDTYDYWLADVVIATVFPAVGALIVSRHPANALGWLFCVAGLFVAVGGLAGEYAVYALVVEPGVVPGGTWAAWTGSFLSEIGFFPLLILVPLLFPDGRPPTRRWRSVVWLVAAVAIGVSRAFWPGPLEDFPRVENPLGVDGPCPTPIPYGQALGGRAHRRRPGCLGRRPSCYGAQRDCCGLPTLPACPRVLPDLLLAAHRGRRFGCLGTSVERSARTMAPPRDDVRSARRRLRVAGSRAC